MQESKKPDVVAPKPAAVVPKEKVATPSAADEALAEAREILAQFDNREANIPHGSKYWTLMNQYRSLAASEKG